MAQIFGRNSGHPLQAPSPVAPTSVPFDSPPRTPLPYLIPDLTAVGSVVAGPAPTPRVPNKINGLRHEALQLAPWFEMMHITPKSIDEGRILSTVNIPVSVHNAYRRLPVGWTSFVNGAGDGSELTGPTPPQTIQPQATISENDLIFVIGTDGVPVVDDTLDFVFDDGSTLYMPIEFSRLVFFSFFPEEGYREELGFLTEILTSKNGTEQRHALRRYPRQKFILEFREDSTELTRLLSTLLGRPGATYGIPLWHEACVLSQAATALDTVINVDSTAYRDFRTLGTAVIFQSSGVHDIIQIDSFGGSSITSVNPIVNSYPVGTLVMPVRLASTNARQRGSRWLRRGSKLNFEFMVKDVDVDLADVSAWPTLNSKILLDDGNAGRQTVREAVEAPIVIFDPEIGEREQYSFAPTGRYTTRKEWYPQGIAYLWQIRQLLHALRGRQTSFYLPSDRDAMNVTTDITLGSSEFIIDNAGIRYIVGTTAFGYVRITEEDGTVTTVEILSVVQSVDTLTETITIDGTFAADIDAADIVRCELIQKVRFDSDNISIRYERGRPGARVSAPVKTVLD